MRVKVCPKCGSESKPDKAFCSGCYASLEGVPETEGARRPAPVTTQPVQVRPPAAAPLGQAGPSSPGAPPSSNYAPPPGAPSSYGPTFSERRQPTKQPTNWGAIIFVILILAGGAFAGWWFFFKPPSPEAVIQRMVDATKEGDWDKMKSCLSASSISAFQMFGEDKLKESFKKEAGKGSDSKIVRTSYENDGKTAIVEVESATGASMSPIPGMKSQELVLLKEGNEWKLDFMATGLRIRKKMYPNGMPGMPGR